MQNDYLNQILVSNSNNESTLPDLLNSVFEDRDLMYCQPSIYIEWSEGSTEDPMQSPCVLHGQNLNPLLKLIGEDSANGILEILKGFEEADGKRQITRSVLYDIIQFLEKAGFKVIAGIRPTESYNAFFVCKQNDEVIPHLLLHHFVEAKESASGWFDDFYSDYDKAFSDYLNDRYSHLLDTKYVAQGVDFSDRSQLKFVMEEDMFLGKICRDNLEVLNLDEVIFEVEKKGMLSAKKFC
jgi:hypothetical protein